MSTELWTRPLSGTAAQGNRTYPSQKGSVAVVTYPEEFSGSNATDRYRQGVNVRTIDDLYMYPGLKPQPINDLHKVRDGKVVFDWTPFDDNESPINMGISSKTVYSGTIVYSSSLSQDPTALHGFLAPSIGSGTIRFYRANDLVITKALINGVFVYIEDAAVPHHQRLKFTFNSSQAGITRAGNDVTIGVSAMNDSQGYVNSINSGSLAARLVHAINSASADFSCGFAVKAFSGSIPASNIFTGTQQGQSDTVTITQNDVGTLILSRSVFDGYNVQGGGGIKKGAGGSTITVSAATYLSASGFDGARTITFLTNSSGLVGRRDLYEVGTTRTNESLHYIFTGKDFVSGNAGKDIVPQYRYLQSTQKYGQRGRNINLRYRLLKGPFSSTEGSGIKSGTWSKYSANTFAGEAPNLSGQGLYLEVSNTGVTGSWSTLAYHSSSNFTSGFTSAVTSSIDCWTGPKYFRFIQKKFHGQTGDNPGYDHWAISELFVEENIRKQDSVQPLSERSRVVLDPTNNQSGVRTAPNHFWDDRDLGMTDVYQDGELFKDTATVNPVEIITQDPLTIDIPKMMVDASDQGLMDGVLEPFPIRSVADRSNIQLPYTARGIKADMTLTDVYRKSDTISQEYRKRSVRTTKLPAPDKIHSGDSNYLVIPISSSLGRGTNYLQGTHLPSTGSAVQFFVPSYQIRPGKEYLTAHEKTAGKTQVAKTGRHMTILLHTHPEAVITGTHDAYAYRQIAIGPNFWNGFEYVATGTAGASDAKIVSVAARLRDDIVNAINGVAGTNIARGSDTVSNFGIRAESLGGVITGTLGGGPAKFFRIRLKATVPGKRGDHITINQVSGTDESPGNELVNGVSTYSFAGGKGILRQRRRHVVKGNDSYFDGVEVFGLDILDNADRVKKRILEVVIDSETGDKAPVEAYEDWVAMGISGTYGKSHIAPIQMQGFVAPSNATLGAFDDASDTILRVRGINDAADLFAASDESYTTQLNTAFKSINTTLYSATTSSAPLYQNTGGVTASGTVGKGFPELSPAYFTTADTAMSNLVSHHSFMGSTTPAKRSNTSVGPATQGSWELVGSSPFISSQGVGSAKVAASSAMTFPTVLTLGPHRAYSGNRNKLPEHYLRVTGTPSDGHTFTLTDSDSTSRVFEFDTNHSYTAGRTAVYINGLSTTSQRAAAIAKAINDYATGSEGRLLKISALSGSHSGLSSAATDTVRLVSHVEGDTTSAIAESLGTLTGSHPSQNHAGITSNTKFATGSISSRDTAFTLSFWMKGDGDRNFYLAQSYCASDAAGASNYGSRNWNIRFTGNDYETYSYQYMYFYLFDNDNYPTNYSFLYRRMYGHTSGNGFGNTKLVNAMSDGKWHHFVISYDGDIDSTLTYNENIPKKKAVGKIEVKTADTSLLNDKFFTITDVSGNYIYFKFKSDNTTVDGSFCAGSTLYVNVGIQGCTTIEQIKQRIATTINVVTTNSSNGLTLNVHAYTFGSSGTSYYASSGGANIINFGSSPAELSFNGAAGNEGDTNTNTGYASSAETLTSSGPILLIQQYAGTPRITSMYDNISSDYFATTAFAGQSGYYYDEIANYYVNVEPVTVDGKSREHFKLCIDGEDITDTYSSTESSAMAHYSGGTSGTGSRYKSMGKNSTAKIEIGGLSSYSSWSSYTPSIFVENPLAEIAFYKGLLDTTSISAIYEMSLIQDVDMLSSKPLVAALMKSNVSAQDLLSRDHVSATAGYEYNNNIEVGTDSLAFGGLKK